MHGLIGFLHTSTRAVKLRNTAGSAEEGGFCTGTSADGARADRVQQLDTQVSTLVSKDHHGMMVLHFSWAGIALDVVKYFENVLYK